MNRSALYLAGPYTASTDAQRLYNMGRLYAYYVSLVRHYNVICVPLMSFGMENAYPHITHSEWIDNCTFWIDHCPAIAFVPGWEHSDGSVLEFDYATNRMKQLRFLDPINESNGVGLIKRINSIHPISPIADSAISYIITSYTVKQP